jgi:hypothetical protein
LHADAPRYTVICEADVMSSFLLLCEHVGTANRIDDFITQASAVPGQIENAKGNWRGTSLAARTAAMVLRLADTNFRLRSDQGKVFCTSALIDLGDRRSAALEQTPSVRRKLCMSELCIRLGRSEC